MKDFGGKIAIVTGAGSGMGRELALQLATEGCHVAMCDVQAGAMEETRVACEKAAPAGTRVTAHGCDMGLEADVVAFRDAAVEAHATDRVHLLFNNAGIGGGGSFVTDSRQEWDRVFAVCWSGVYYATRAFLPLMIASEGAHLINTSSVNGFWASLGPGIPHTAYSAAKFAVKGFTEALISDLKENAPHVKVSVVMPGHIGTSIAINAHALLNKNAPADMSSEELLPIRRRLEGMGIPTKDITDDMLRAGYAQRLKDFRDKAPMSAAQAATVMLDAVRHERWRVLVGEDAIKLDAAVRADPEAAYDPTFIRALKIFGQS